MKKKWPSDLEWLCQNYKLNINLSYLPNVIDAYCIALNFGLTCPKMKKLAMNDLAVDAAAAAVNLTALTEHTPMAWDDT